MQNTPTKSILVLQDQLNNLSTPGSGTIFKNDQIDQVDDITPVKDIKITMPDAPRKRKLTFTANIHIDDKFKNKLDNLDN